MNLELTFTEAKILRFLLNNAHEMCRDGQAIDFEWLGLNEEDKEPLRAAVASTFKLDEVEGLRDDAGLEDIFLYLYFAQKLENLVAELDENPRTTHLPVDSSSDRPE